MSILDSPPSDFPAFRVPSRREQLEAAGLRVLTAPPLIPERDCLSCGSLAVAVAPFLGRDHALCEKCAAPTVCDCRHTAPEGLVVWDGEGEEAVLRCPWCAAMELGWDAEDFIAELVGRHIETYAAETALGEQAFPCRCLAQDEVTVDTTGIPREDLCEHRTVRGEKNGLQWAATVFSFGSEGGRETTRYVLQEVR